MAQVGLEPTASLVLGQGGLPIAYRAVLTDVPKAGVEPANTRRPTFDRCPSRVALPVGVPGRLNE